MQKLQVRPYDWIVKDEEDEQGEVRSNIHCWAFDKNSKPVLLRIYNFPVFCFLELPKIVNNYHARWDRYKAYDLMKNLESVFKDKAPLQYEYKDTKMLYYFNAVQDRETGELRDRTYPVVRLVFKNRGDMNYCNKILSGPIRTRDFGMVNCKIWENQIPLERKLITAKNIGYCSWIDVQGYVPEKKIATTDEYIVDWTTMRRTPMEECANWEIKPRIVSFDIECYSDNKRAMPDKYNAKHVSFVITVAYQKLGERNTRKRWAVVLGDAHEFPEDELETTIVRVDTEIDLIEKFGELIIELDADVIIGYNTFGFDWPYLAHRMERFLQEWPAKMSRVPSDPAKMTDKSWKSDAYGWNKISYLSMEGRLNIDMLKIVNRDYKLDKYSLAFVSAHFLRYTKKDLTPQELFEYFEEYMNARKNLAEVINDDSEAKKDDAEKVAWTAYEAAKYKMTTILVYGITDAEIPIDLFEKLNVWISLLELSEIVGVTITDLFTRGQQVRCVSQLYDEAAKQGYIINGRNAPDMFFNGGHVEKPVPGLYDNVICEDFSSMYPSIIMTYNICYSTLIPKEKEDEIPTDDCNVIEFDQEEPINKKYLNEDEEYESDEEEEIVGKKVLKHYKHSWYKGRKGILPALEERLVDERKKVKNEMKVAAKKEGENSVAYIVLDKRQNALKVSANSFFGFLGVRNGKLPLMEGAMSITGWGRQLIGKVNEYLLNTYGGKIVYGDTDSTMVQLPQIKDSSECHYWGKRLEHEINGVKAGDKDPNGVPYPEDRKGLFFGRLKVEYEKGMRLLCFTPKKYAAYFIEKDGSFKMIDIKDKYTGEVIGKKRYLMTKGIVLARRDNFKELRQIYEGLLIKVMNRESFPDAIFPVIDKVKELLDGNVEVKNLIYIRGLGAQYKSASYFMKVFGDNLRNAGKFAEAGDRLEYLVIKKPGERLLGNRMVLPEQYYESLDSETPMKIDYSYYVEKGLMKPINQLIQFGFKADLEKLSDYFYKPNGRSKAIGMDRLILLLLKMHEKKISFEVLKNEIRIRYGMKKRILFEFSDDEEE